MAVDQYFLCLGEKFSIRIESTQKLPKTYICDQRSKPDHYTRIMGVISLQF